ncbi:hypothetical protein TNCV_817231 [Trichonephila clavipes]|nr:hypothetical protein TNCV_817231 [Trichonephila clavipes]
MVMRERKGTIDGYEWRCRTKGGENPHDEWVVPGSVIISTVGRPTIAFSHEGYQHLRVNHSLTFKDPESGAHTNSIKARGRRQKDRYGTMRRMWRANSTTI